MVSAQVTIHTPHGLHLRPAGELAEEALKYRCRVSLAHGDKEILSLIHISEPTRP